MFGTLMMSATNAQKFKSQLSGRTFLADKLDISVESEEVAKSEMIRSKDFVVIESVCGGVTETVMLNFSDEIFGVGKVIIRLPEVGKFTVLVKQNYNPKFQEKILGKDYTLCEFLDRLESVMMGEKSEKGIKRVIELFTKIGLFANLEGHGFLISAVRRSLADPSELHSVTTRLYHEIAEEYHTTSKAVERNIRNAITVAYNKGKLVKVANTYYGANFDENEKPTNSEFIAFLTTVASMD